MKKIIIIILLVCLCFLTGCVENKEYGFDEHYDEKPYIYMGIKCNSKKEDISNVQVELAFGWEEYPDMYIAYSGIDKEQDVEFKGVVIGSSFYDYMEYNDGVYFEKDGSLYIKEGKNLIYLDEEECKNDKYKVTITGFRKPNYNNIQNYKIDSSLIEIGRFHICIVQLFYSKARDAYFTKRVNSIEIWAEENNKGLIDLIIVR